MPEELIPNDLSEKQLKWGYWFVTHKIALRRVLEIFLIVFSAANLGFSGYYLYLDIANTTERQQMLGELLTGGLNPAVTAKQSPRSLQAGSVQVLAPAGKYDFLASVANPNPYYAARFSYRFVYGNTATAPEAGFILPGEQKFVVKLGVVSSGRPAGTALEIVSVDWERIDRHKYPDWKGFASEHLNFPITDISYTAEIDLAEGKPSIGRTSFTIANQTGYGYYGVRAIVIMYRGPAAVAVNTTAFPVLMPNASQSGAVTWFEKYDSVTQIKVFPEVDILNDASYVRGK